MFGRAVVAVVLAAPAMAQTPMPIPKQSQAEGLQLFTAAGFTIKGGRALNICGNPASPRFTYVDLNADGRAEAVGHDTDIKCYGSQGMFKVMARTPGKPWRLVGSGQGTFKALPARTKGWNDYTLEGPGCQPVWKFTGSEYRVPEQCPLTLPATISGAAAAPVAAKPSATEEAAIFKAANFAKVGKQWHGCGDPGTASYSPGYIDTYRDLNGDGRPDAVITEGSSYCFGMTGQGYSLVSKQANGTWKLLDGGQGIPNFLATKGVAGWPDIEIGGPGFCFPVVRWNGKTYQLNRHQYEGKSCRPN